MLVNHSLDVSSPQGRFMEGSAVLDGQICTGVEAYGKHLLYEFANDVTLHIHLGLFGKFHATKRPALEPRGAVRVRLLSKTHVIDINGPNTCELLDGEARLSLISRIGPDVLRKDADPKRAWSKISASRLSIGQLLMDQAVIGGIGNIYRSEILWRQKLHPETPGKNVDFSVFERIWHDAVHLLEIGVRHNAIITNDSAIESRSKYGERVNIFNKAACPLCGSNIRKFEIAARRAFVCETCQIPHRAT
eukprot:gene12162-12249_t